VALTRLNSSPARISSSAAANDVNSPAVSRPIAISRLPYTARRLAVAMPPRNSISGAASSTPVT
jgi:hypothetical protein